VVEPLLLVDTTAVAPFWGTVNVSQPFGAGFTVLENWLEGHDVLVLRRGHARILELFR
jgi:hypothetical protein